jgi:hypothetical protein
MRIAHLEFLEKSTYVVVLELGVGGDLSVNLSGDGLNLGS